MSVEEQYEQKWQLPDRLRVDLNTEESRALLADADAKQAEWAAEFNTPFQNTSPLIRERARAGILRNEYEGYGYANLTESQKGELAEAYAVLGFFEKAAEWHPNDGRAAELTDIWEGLWRNDEDWCEHGTAAQYAMRDVYSIRHSADVSIVRCGECGFVNARPTPEHITEARKSRTAHREKYAGLGPAETKRRLAE